MKLPRRSLVPLFGLAVVIVGCSQGQERGSRGSLAVRLAVSRPAAGASDVSADPSSHLQAAEVNISGIEARRLEGGWVPTGSALPAAVELLALANVGDKATFPADLLPEGHYTALQVRFNQVGVTLTGGTKMALAPQGTGWVVLIPVDFDVTADRGTVVGLNIRLDQSFRSVSGHFEFDPQVDLDGVERE
jgi:hypothetical protein